jgi:glutathione synthase
MKRFNNALDILVVMDPIGSIAPKKDSSFAMMLEAQRRGWRVLYAELGDIWIRNGKAWGQLTELQVFDKPSDWFELGSVSVEPLEEMDVIIMRVDPPFDMEYIYATYILERAEIHGALVVNRPQGLRTANEKAFVSWFPECAAPTLISRSLDKLGAFIDEHERVVVKPLDRMAGKSVFLTGVADPNRHVLLETMTDYGSRYILAQGYLPEVVETGDSRILLIDGEPIPYALVRFAPAGDHRANMSVGARTEVRSLTAVELRICDRLSPVLQEMGLLFVGIDVIGEHLTEINVTSPTGIRELDRARELNVAGELLNSIEAKINRSRKVNLHQKAT